MMPDLRLLRCAAAAAIDGWPMPPGISRDAVETAKPGGRPGIPAPGGIPEQ